MDAINGVFFLKFSVFFKSSCKIPNMTSENNSSLVEVEDEEPQTSFVHLVLTPSIVSKLHSSLRSIF